MIISCIISATKLPYVHASYLPGSQVRSEEQNILSCTARHGILVHTPYHHERVSATIHTLCSGFREWWGLTDLSQAVKAASAARYLAELQATPTW